MSFVIKHKRKIYVPAVEPHGCVFNKIPNRIRVYKVPKGPHEGVWAVFEALPRMAEECIWRPMMENGWLGNVEHHDDAVKLFNPDFYTPEHVNGNRRDYSDLPLGMIVGKKKGHDDVVVLAALNNLYPTSITSLEYYELNASKLPIGFGVMAVGHTVPEAMHIAANMNDRVVGDWFEIDIDELFGVLDHVDSEGYLVMHDKYVKNAFKTFSVRKVPVAKNYPNSL